MWELCGLSGPHTTEVTGCNGTRDSGVPLESEALYMSLVLGTHANPSLVQEAWLSVVRPEYPGLHSMSVL